MTAEIRVGILGCGKIANTDHIPGFLGLEGFRITALCDVKPGAIEESSRSGQFAAVEQFPDDEVMIPG